MTARIEYLKKDNGEATITGAEIIKHDSSNGRIVGLQYLVPGIQSGKESPGRLHVHELGTSLEVYKRNVGSNIKVIDTESGSTKTEYSYREIAVRGGLKLEVIETEVWNTNTDIGVRIRHVDEENISYLKK
jgi:hypothetical protein